MISKWRCEGGVEFFACYFGRKQYIQYVNGIRW
jgi:hypothetical protein